MALSLRPPHVPPGVCDAPGFGVIQRVGGFAAVDAHTRALADHTAAELARLRHRDGSPAINVRVLPCAPEAKLCAKALAPSAATTVSDSTSRHLKVDV